MSTRKKRSAASIIHHLELELRPKRSSTRHARIGGAIAEWWVLARSRAEAMDTACSVMEYDGWDIVRLQANEELEACPYGVQDERHAHYQKALRDGTAYLLKTWPKREDERDRVQ